MITRKRILFLIIGLAVILAACGREGSIYEPAEEEPAPSPVAGSSLEGEKPEITYDDEHSIYTIKTKLEASEAVILEDSGEIKLLNLRDGLSYAIDLSIPGIGNPESSSAAVFNTIKSTGNIDVSKGFVSLVAHEDYYRVLHNYNGADKEIGKLKTIGEELQNSYVLSDDKSKLAFVEGNSIVVYSFNSGRLVRLHVDSIEALKTDFASKAFFSPRAGYITLLVQNKDGAVGFKGFGADSGKLLHDTIYGISPVWSHNELYISFLHKSSPAPPEKHLDNSEDMLLSDKIAILNRKTKRVTFFAEFGSGTFIIGKPIWAADDSGVIFTTGSDRISDIHLYRLKSRDIITLSETGMNDGSSKELSDIQLAGNQIIYSLKDPRGKNELILVDLGGGGTTVIEDVIPVKYVSDGEEYEKIYSLLNNHIVFVKGDSVYRVEGSTVTALIRNRHTLVRLQHLEKSGLLASYAINGGALELMLAKIH